MFHPNSYMFCVTVYRPFPLHLWVTCSKTDFLLLSGHFFSFNFYIHRWCLNVYCLDKLVFVKTLTWLFFVVKSNWLVVAAHTPNTNPNQSDDRAKQHSNSVCEHTSKDSE